MSNTPLSISVVTDPKAAPGNLVRALASMLLDCARREVAEQCKEEKLVVSK
jgi:hypothetical protein